MQARQTLNTHGFLVLYGAVPDDVTNGLRSLSREGNNFWIHDTWNNIEHDEHRFRSFVPDSSARALTVDLVCHYRTFFEGASATEWRFLKTEAGADDQLVRREFTPRPSGEESMNVTSVPGSMYLVLDNNTFFYTFGWNNHIAMMSSRRLIHLNQGDILLLRGDCMFAGVGYPRNNVCVHGFIDTPDFARPEYQPPDIIPVMDRHDVDERFCFVYNCPYQASSPRSLRKHLNRFHGFYFRSTHTAAAAP